MDISKHRANYEYLKQLKNEDRKVLRIGVCGRFKSGKTSLLNLLLGLNLPVKPGTATGTVTKIQYEFKNFVELPGNYYREVSDDELKKYIEIKDKTLDGIELGEAVTVFAACRHDLLEYGSVEFWDTPGLEDDYRLTKITLEALEKCDVVVLVLDATRLLSQNEKMLLNENGKLQEYVGKNIIIAVNHIDSLTEKDMEDIKQELRDLDIEAVFTCAKPDAPDITDLQKKISYICKDVNARRACIATARKAKCYAYAKKWHEALIADLEQIVNEKNALVQKLENSRNEHIRAIERSYNEDKAMLLEAIRTSSEKLDSVRYWTTVLHQICTTPNWEKNYTTLSEYAMKKGLAEIFHKINFAVDSSINRLEYPECYPSPSLNVEYINNNIWREMNWGKNFDVNNAGGMIAGALTGAAIGSAVPVIGTLFGAVGGFILGAGHDAEQDEKAKVQFREQCIPATVRAFLGSPVYVAKQEVQKFCQKIIQQMEEAAIRKKENLSLTANSDQQECYNLSQQITELEKYMKTLKPYLKAK